MIQSPFLRIGDVCVSISETYNKKADTVILINTSDVLEGKVLNHIPVPNKNLKGQFKKTFQKDDILYSEIRPQNKRFAYVDFIPDNYIASTKLMIIRANQERVLPLYLYYFLKSQPVIDELQMLAETRSGTFPQITFSELSNLLIPVPSLIIQERIVGILKSIDDKIALNNKINDNLEQQAEALFKAWFFDYLPFGGEMPQEWTESTIEELTSLVSRGIAPKYTEDSDQVIINQKCIRDHRIDLSLARTHTPKKINEKWLQFGDLLINSTGEGTLGRTAQVWFNPEKMTVDSHVTIVRPKSKELIYYIGFWGLLHEREIESLHTGSTGQTELPRERIKAMELVLPDQATLAKFNAIVQPMTETIVNNQVQNNKLAALRDTLLPKLMAGEIL